MGTFDHNQIKFRIEQPGVGFSEIRICDRLEVRARKRLMRGALLVITIGYYQDSSCLRHLVAEPRKDAGRMPANRRQGYLRSPTVRKDLLGTESYKFRFRDRLSNESSKRNGPRC